MLLFMDSFAHYVTADLATKWPSSAGTVAITATDGRRSSPGLRFSSSVAYAMRGPSPADTTAIVGTAFKANTLAVGTDPLNFLGVYDLNANREHVHLRANADGSIAAYRGSTAVFGPGNPISATLLGSSAGSVLAAGVYAYVELKVVIHDSAGAVTVRVNGTAVLTLTSIDTANGSSAWTSVWLGCYGEGKTVDFDDVYVLDGTGAAPWNTFLGDCRVDPLVPTAAGATTGWTPSTGANWQNVDDAAPNGDTDYNSAATSPLTDTFVVQDAPVVGATIYGLQHCLNMKKSDAGVCTVAPVIRHSGVDYPGTALSPGLTYAYGLQIAATNPGTSAAWVEADFNAAQFGYKRTA
jgi:hypothetical protein